MVWQGSTKIQMKYEVNCIACKTIVLYECVGSEVDKPFLCTKCAQKVREAPDLYWRLALDVLAADAVRNPASEGAVFPHREIAPRVLSPDRPNRLREAAEREKKRSMND